MADTFVWWESTLPEDTYHAPECHGACDGCGYIAADGAWYAGPCPLEDAPYQQERAEG